MAHFIPDDDYFEVYMIFDQTIRASKIQMNEINPKNMDTQRFAAHQTGCMIMREFKRGLD